MNAKQSNTPPMPKIGWDKISMGGTGYFEYDLFTGRCRGNEIYYKVIFYGYPGMPGIDDYWGGDYPSKKSQISKEFFREAVQVVKDRVFGTKHLQFTVIKHGLTKRVPETNKEEFPGVSFVYVILKPKYK